MNVCSIAGCARKHRAKGYCGPHYARNLKYGDPMAHVPVGSRASSPEESFLANSEPLAWSGCIVWSGRAREDGYGVIYVGREPVLAHRYAWERERGPIPEGLHVDHVCHVRSCVNVEHLRLATPAQNTYNRQGVKPNRKHDLPRNISPGRGGYAVRVTKAGVRHNSWGRTLPEAIAEAERLRGELFGDYAGQG